MESLKDLYLTCRSYRRFKQKQIPRSVLLEIADIARTRSNGMNAQRLRLIIVSSPDKVAKIQPCLKWAAKLPKEIGTPEKDETPVAFAVIIAPEHKDRIIEIDTGIALDSMAVTAWSHGVGSCIIASFDKAELDRIVSPPAGYESSMVLALGYPDHKSIIVEPDEKTGLDYYTDENHDFYVPKRPFDDVVKII